MSLRYRFCYLSVCEERKLLSVDINHLIMLSTKGTEVGFLLLYKLWKNQASMLACVLLQIFLFPVDTCVVVHLLNMLRTSFQALHKM